MPWKDTLAHRQKFCNLRRTCAGNDRPLKGADHFQPRPLVGATSETKVSYSFFRHDKGDVDMHSPYNKMPSHFSTCFNQPECAELPRKLARAFGHTSHQPGTRKHQRDTLAEFALVATQQAHDRDSSHTKVAGARNLDLESMD